MQLPNWAYGWLGFAAFAYILEFFIDEATSLPDTSGNLLDTIINLVGFTAIDDTPTWVSFALFMLISMPGLLILLSALINLAAGSTAGLIAVALLTSAIALVGFF